MANDAGDTHPGAACFHCGLPVPPGTRFHLEIDGAERAMCCPGCVAVAELILGTGLTAYYRYREQPAANPEFARSTALDELQRYDLPAVQRTFVHSGEGAVRHATLAMNGMRCAACVWLIERHLRRQPGVTDIVINLGSERAQLSWRDGETRLSTLLREIARLGYGAHPYRPDWQEAARHEEFRAALRRLAVAGIGAMQVMMFAAALYAGALQGMAQSYREFLRIVSALVATPVIVYAARPFFLSAWRDLRNRRLGMDVPVALAIASAYAASLAATTLRMGEVYFDSACMFVFLLSLGRFLEMRARHRAADRVEGALRRPPETATRLVEQRQEVVAVHELVAGDRALVKPGETVPADGRVAEGIGWVNESMLTGEHWPRRKAPGDAVVGGTQNGESPLTIVVERAGSESVLAGIIRLVDRAGVEKPPIARLADRAAQVFVPGVLVLAALVAVAWWPSGPARAFWITLSVLVVSCPCALSLATPAALTAATGGLLRRGLVVTRGHVVEGLFRATHVVFDKTGTLTRGRFRLVSARALREVPVDECMRVATLLESRSEHPIARAFDAPAAEPAGHMRDVVAEAGQGVAGIVDERRYRIGRWAWVAEGWRTPWPTKGPDSGAVSILLGDEDGPLCWFELEDAVRAEAAPTVHALQRRGLTVEVVSGDSPGAVQRIAERLGLRAAMAGATPDDKLRHVQGLQASGAVVVMVGDGINDVPVLGAAQVAVAMGAGTDLAMSRSDAVLLKEDLSVLVDAIDLARKTRRVMRQNLLWALGYNALALPLAACGFVTPYWAALGMSVSSLIVVLNAVRLGTVARAPRAEVLPVGPLGAVATEPSR
jgi:Cu2+-exporting ATPase